MSPRFFGTKNKAHGKGGNRSFKYPGTRAHGGRGMHVSHATVTLATTAARERGSLQVMMMMMLFITIFAGD